MSKDKQATIEKLAKKLLSLMGTQARVEVVEQKDSVVVNIATEDEAGLLIGRKGETLNSIQSILGIMTHQALGEWIRIVVNLGDWREKQEDYLKNVAREAAEKANETGEDQPIYNLSAAERRIIHVELAENNDVTTESAGEGRERYLIVRPKK